MGAGHGHLRHASWRLWRLGWAPRLAMEPAGTMHRLPAVWARICAAAVLPSRGRPLCSCGAHRLSVSSSPLVRRAVSSLLARALHSTRIVSTGAHAIIGEDEDACSRALNPHQEAMRPSMLACSCSCGCASTLIARCVFLDYRPCLATRLSVVSLSTMHLVSRAALSTTSAVRETRCALLHSQRGRLAASPRHDTICFQSRCSQALLSGGKGHRDNGSRLGLSVARKRVSMLVRHRARTACAELKAKGSRDDVTPSHKKALESAAEVIQLQDASLVEWSRMRVKAGIACLAAIVIFAILFVTVVLAITSTRQEFVDTQANLVDHQGSPLKTATIETRVTLMDLPQLGLDSLNQIHRLTYMTQAGLSSASIVGYDLSAAGVLRLYTAHSPSQIITINGTHANLTQSLPHGGITETAIWTDQTQSCVRSASGSCLERPAPSQRSALSSFGTVAQVRLEAESVWQLLEISNQTFFGSATTVGERGELVTIKIASYGEGDTAIWVSNSTLTAMWRDGVLFQFVGANLFSCKEGTQIRSIIESVATDPSDGKLGFSITYLYNGMEVPQTFIPATPTLDDCMAVLLHDLPANLTTNGSGTEEHVIRRLGRIEGESVLSMHTKLRANAWWYVETLKLIANREGVSHRRLSTMQSQLAYNVYDVDNSLNCYASTSACYEYENAFAYRDDCKFVFRGSNDIWDYVSNAKGVLDVAKVGHGSITLSNQGYGRLATGEFYVHVGFASELKKLTDHTGLSRDVSSCPHNELEFIGHSLGGAMANIAKIYYGMGNVVTFGAPQLFYFSHTFPGKYKKQGACGVFSPQYCAPCNADWGPAVPLVCEWVHGETVYFGSAHDCYMGGIRLFNEYDPVPGNLCGANSAYWHTGGATKMVWHCDDYSYLGYCRNEGRYSLENADCTANSGTWNTNIGGNPHGIGLYDEYA